MGKKFGVQMSDELAERVEAPLEYGDSRSERISELVEIGLTAEDALAGTELDLPDSRAKSAFVRQAIIDAAARERAAADDDDGRRPGARDDG